MKVINLGNKDFKYFTKGTVVILKAGVINEVDETLVTAKKLKDCYGNRISIIDENAIVEEYKAFAGDVKAAQPEQPQEDSSEEIKGSQDNGKPEKCSECYVNGKTPNEEDCKVCQKGDEDQLNNSSDAEGSEGNDEKKKLEIKTSKSKKQVSKKSGKNKNK